MSKIAKFRSIIDLIKVVKRSKHKGYADLRWIMEASEDSFDELAEVLHQLCECGVLREETDEKGIRICYYIVSENIEDFTSVSDTEILIENSPQTAERMSPLASNSSDAPKSKGPQLLVSENKWLDENTEGAWSLPVSDNHVTNEDFISFKDNILNLINLVHKDVKHIEGYQKSFFKEEIFNHMREEIMAKDEIIRVLKTDNERLANPVVLPTEPPTATPQIPQVARLENANDTWQSPTALDRPTWTAINSPPAVSASNASPSIVKSRPSPSQQSVRKRPSVVITEKHSNNNISPFKRVVPGNVTYAEKVRNGKNIFLYGDSELNRISGKYWSKNIENGRIFVRPFTSATSEQIAWHIEPSVIDDKPDVAVIHSGINNVLQGKSSEAEIAEGILNIGRKCRNMGVKNVFISSIFCVKNRELNTTVKNVNCILRERALNENFIFIDNSDVNENHLYTDGIHLNNEGRDVFMNNTINYLNHFL